MWSRGAAAPRNKDSSLCRDSLVPEALLAVLVLPSLTSQHSSLRVRWVP